jgi:hypothetical protein
MQELYQIWCRRACGTVYVVRLLPDPAAPKGLRVCGVYGPVDPMDLVDVDVVKEYPYRCGREAGDLAARHAEFTCHVCRPYIGRRSGRQRSS